MTNLWKCQNFPLRKIPSWNLYKTHCPSVDAHFPPRVSGHQTKFSSNRNQPVMPSRVFSAAVVYVLLALFAARTLGDNQLNKFLQHTVGGQVRIKNANVVGAQEIVRKQSENTCSPYSNEYNRRMSALQCNEEYIRAVREEKACDYRFLYSASARYDPLNFYDCGTNRNGTLCAEINDAGGVYGYYSQAFYECFRSSPSTGNCESECKIALSQLVAQVGCCIHASDNLLSDIILTPSLWETCDIDRPQPCADTPQPITTPAECSYECSLRQYYYSYCRSLSNEVKKINMECGVDPQSGLHNCRFDKGNYCYLMDIFNNPDSYFATVYDKCFTFFAENVATKRVCTSECKGAVQEVKDRYGCCVEYYNNSNTYDVGGQVMRSDLWVACGIDTLENCELGSAPDDYLDGGECGAGVTLHVSFTSIFIAVIIFFITT